MTDMPEWEDDDVIELTDIVEDDADAGDDGMIELTDIVEDDGDMSEPAETPVLAQAAAAAPEIRMEDLEAALERVIEAKFSDKIESILFEVMERVIEKEIAQIKESLQKDLDQIGNI